tara:strand:- start:608 stop:1024 length:417 start_codon:yes stop_codon:yes gene_type:complete
MANTVCTSFKSQLLTGTHDFSTDTFKLALYTSSASSLADYTIYAVTNEASGSGYTAGGTTLSGGTVSTSGTTAYADFTADATFTSVTITARYALIYNSSESNKACFFLDFGADKTATNGTFTITFPSPGASALLTVTG